MIPSALRYAETRNQQSTIINQLAVSNPPRRTFSTIPLFLTHLSFLNFNKSSTSAISFVRPVALLFFTSSLKEMK